MVDSKPLVNTPIPDTGSVMMEVFDENDEDITGQGVALKRCTATQTEPLKTLPCSSCIENDVTLHPAVTEGYVDPSFAAAFIDAPSNPAKPVEKRKLSRDTSKGRCLTHQSEVERLANLNREKKRRKKRLLNGKPLLNNVKKRKSRPQYGKMS